MDVLFVYILLINTPLFPLPDTTIEDANWDASKVKEELCRDIDAHISSVRNVKLLELTTIYEVILFYSILITVLFRCAYDPDQE